MTSNEALRSLEVQAAPYDLETQTATEVMHVIIILIVILIIITIIALITILILVLLLVLALALARIIILILIDNRLRNTNKVYEDTCLARIARKPFFLRFLSISTPRKLAISSTVACIASCASSTSFAAFSTAPRVLAWSSLFSS